MQDQVKAPPTEQQARTVVHLTARPLSVGPKPQPKPRKPRDATLVKRVEKATERQAIGITYHADGSRTVAVHALPANDDNEWDEVLTS